MIDYYSWRLWRAVKDGAAAFARLTARRPLVMATVWVLAFCAFSMVALDRPVAWFFKTHLSTEAEGFFKVLTRFGEGVVFIVPTLVVWVFLRWRAARALSLDLRQRWLRASRIALFMLTNLLVSGAAVNGLKFLVGRYRPRYLFDDNLYGFSPLNTHWGMNSFPSGHSQAIFAAMTSLYVIFPRYDLAWIAIAALVAMSRLVTTVHYLSDVVAGAYMGILVTILVKAAFERRGVDVRVRLARDARL